MTKTEFENDLEIGWDFAIENIQRNTSNTDIKILCDIYFKGYSTTNFINTIDCDDGLCFAIREFAITQIYEILEDTE